MPCHRVPSPTARNVVRAGGRRGTPRIRSRCAQPSALQAVSGQLEVTGPRAQVMPNGMGAVYLSVFNPGSRSERLVSVESAAVSVIETHESVDDDGVVRMVPRPEGFEIPAGGTLALEPGGKHIMLMGPQLEEGATTIPLTLHFEHAGPVEIEAALVQMPKREP